MADSDLNWSNVAIGSKLLMTNSGGSRGLANAIVNCDCIEETGDETAFDGPITGTQTVSLKYDGVWVINWLIIASADVDGTSGAAGLTVQVLNSDGSVNGTTFTTSYTTPDSDPASLSGTLKVGVVASS